ncbi:catabolite repressor/activator [Agarivorans sp. B2Z047]|uniref:catabolite repressor/activator n=1 Tax=Agarivorans sp. B2Z047 TaxID=2652721 RepID=UPI001406D4D6|nr:catabolite repressor/activator [Agarivorans sp. B2Z047]MPW31844.1 catabolite repressor/activator [Agarivorans sp. B2Z047]UQN43691.1 catabolite repressor/activator [Agarivorans sp. B2Z047]
MKLDEIAKLAGVSRTTASYVINGKAEQYRISVKTQEKVLAVVNQHGFQPNHSASTLRAGVSKTFGLIVPDLENASYARLAKLLESAARKHGYHLLISCSDDEYGNEKEVANSLVSRRIDVLLVASCIPPTDSFYEEIQQRGTPVIAIDRMFNDEIFASVISEDFNGAVKLTEALLARGSQSIALFGAVPELVISKEREAGFHHAIKRAACFSDKQVSVYYGEHFSREEGQKLATQMMLESLVPDAILVSSYVLFEGILDCLSKYPEVLKSATLATFGDNQLLDMLPFKVISLPQQFDKIAERVLELALNAAKGDYERGVDIVSRRLVIR